MKPTLYKLLCSVIYLLSALLLAGVVCYLSSCEQTKHKTTDIASLIDVTEPLRSWPEAEAILGLYDLETNPLNGGALHASFVSDVSFNRQTVFSLPAGGNSLMTNRFERMRQTEQFKEHITRFIDSLGTDTTIGRPHSSVYLPLARELDRLAKSTADNRILIVYSDLNENADISFYDPRTRALLRTNPNSIAETLRAKTPLPNLSGIQVYLIFEPHDATEYATFRLVSGFYKTLLESKGATVSISANLIR